MRVGQGFDVHAFGPGNEVILAGVHIPHSHGLVAHSDGDVLLHAICDAILGAAALGDIGQHFPDTDQQYAGACSRSLLRHCLQLVTEAGFFIENIDCTVIAQQPRISGHTIAMQQNIAADLAITTQQVNVKATTTEKLGFTGRKEGVAAMAIVLIQAQP